MKLDKGKLKTGIQKAVQPKREAFEFFNGDSAEVLFKLKPLSIDLVVTSPPYDDLREYNGYSFDFERIAEGLVRVLKPGGVIVWIVNDATVNGSETGTSFRQALHFKELGLNLHDTMVWDKQNCVYPNPARYWSVFEFMFVFSRGTPKVTNLLKDRENKFHGQTIHGLTRQVDGSLTQKSGNGQLIEPLGARHNVWRNQPVFSSIERTGHPAQFPISLAADHIKSWSNPGDRVLDPFMGSGTTGVAAAALDRKFTGIEISKEYFDLAVNRIKFGAKEVL